MDKDDSLAANGQCLDTVRALHQTVVSLRQALEQSRSEIVELKSKSCPLDSIEELLKNLTLENHILRQEIIGYKDKEETKENIEFKDNVNLALENVNTEKQKDPKHVTIISPRSSEKHKAVKKDLLTQKFQQDSGSESTYFAETKEDLRVPKFFTSTPLQTKPVGTERKNLREEGKEKLIRTVNQELQVVQVIKTLPVAVKKQHSAHKKKGDLRNKNKDSQDCFLKEKTNVTNDKNNSEEVLEGPQKSILKRDGSFTKTDSRQKEENNIKKEPQEKHKGNHKTKTTKKSLKEEQDILDREEINKIRGPDISNVKKAKQNFHRLQKEKVHKEKSIKQLNTSANQFKDLENSVKGEKVLKAKHTSFEKPVEDKNLHRREIQEITTYEENLETTTTKSGDVCIKEKKVRRTEKTTKTSKSLNEQSPLIAKLGLPDVPLKQDHLLAANTKKIEENLEEKHGNQVPNIQSTSLVEKPKEKIWTNASNKEQNLPQNRTIDLKIDVTVFKSLKDKPTKEKHLSITIPPEVLYPHSELEEEKSANSKNLLSPDNRASIEDQIASHLIKPEAQHSSGQLKSECEDNFENTDDDVNGDSVYSNEELTQESCAEKETIPVERVVALTHDELDDFEKAIIDLQKLTYSSDESSEESKILITTESLSPRKVSRSLENLHLKSPKKLALISKTLSVSKTLSYSNFSDGNRNSKVVQSFEEFAVMAEEKHNANSGNYSKENMANNLQNGAERDRRDNLRMVGSMQDSQELETEVDEVELIFTTDETKEEDFKEELVSIEMNTDGPQLLQCPASDFERNLSHASNLSGELEDDVFNDNFENENQENSNFQSQTFDFQRENSQLYNSKSDNSINHEEKSLKSYYSYQDSSFENKSIEKDESFDRFDDRVRIIETDISKVGIHDVEYSLGRRNTCPNPIQYRPILHREALGKSGLSSRKCRPILAQSNAARKESGAQTDISALPGSSWRSESNLVHKVKIGDNFTTLPSKYPLPGSRLKLSDKTVEARRILLSDIGFTSMVPELSRSADHLFPPNFKPPPSAPSTTTFGQFLRTPDLYSPGFQSQRFIWNNTATPSEGSHTHSRYSSLYPLTSPPVPTRRCSAPVSPSRKAALKQAPSKVRFANGSLPELRGDWTSTVDSGDSTDSLVEEAEHYLRRSIDCVASGTCSFRSEPCKGSLRRASAPEASRDNVPPQGWQPFLPRIPRDLRLDHWVKVISPEGRVKGGRVRYVGPLLSQNEQFVGVQLSTPDGHSDGTYNSRRYFQCEPYHGIFVPFKKVVMGWRP